MIDLKQALEIADGCSAIAISIATKTRGQPGIFAPREQACHVLAGEVRRLQSANEEMEWGVRRALAAVPWAKQMQKEHGDMQAQLQRIETAVKSVDGWILSGEAGDALAEIRKTLRGEP